MLRSELRQTGSIKQRKGRCHPWVPFVKLLDSARRFTDIPPFNPHNDKRKIVSFSPFFRTRRHDAGKLSHLLKLSLFSRKPRIWTLSLLTHYPASLEFGFSWNGNVAPNPKTRWTATRTGWENKAPSQNRRTPTQTHKHTHTTESFLVFFSKMWAMDMALLMSPYLSLGILQSSRPLGPGHTPNLYCQWLQSSIIQKGLLQKPQTVNPLLCFEWLINCVNQQVLKTGPRSPAKALISQIWAGHTSTWNHEDDFPTTCPSFEELEVAFEHSRMGKGDSTGFGSHR